MSARAESPSPWPVLAAAVLGLSLCQPAAAQTDRDAPRERIAQALTLAELFDLPADLPGAEPILIATVELLERELVREDAEATVQILEDGAEIGYLTAGGALGVYDIGTGKRRRAVQIVEELEEGEPVAYLLDSFQRRVAVADGREIRLQEFPVLAKVRDFKLPKGQDFDPLLTAFCGKATLVASAGDSLRIVTQKKVQNVELPGPAAAIWGNPRELEVLVWCSGEAGDGEPATWALVRVRDQDGWKVEELAALPAATGDLPQWLWSPDGLATAVVTGDRVVSLSTRDGSELASGTLPAGEEGASPPRCEGLTHRGKYLLTVTPGGHRAARKVEQGFPVAREFDLALPADAATLTHRPDRWVAVSLDRQRLYVFGPPSQKAKRW